MKKKLLLIIAALVMVVSGVAAVSAYEAHLINVTAHVENALDVDTTAIDFGTVFPQEFIKFHRVIDLSTSAIAEKGDLPGDLESVTLQAYAEWKPIPADADPFPVPVVQDAQGNQYYAWLGEALYVGFDPSQTPMAITGMTVVGPALAGPQSAQPILGTKTLDGVTTTTLAVAIDAPVFEGFYNVFTDPTPKPSGLDAPTWIIPENDPTGRWIPGGVDLGLDLKIQVINIARVPIAP